MATSYFRKILIPTDFSPIANNAMNHGLALAEKSGAKVTLLHAYALPIILDENGQIVNARDLTNDLTSAAEHELLVLKKEIAISHPKLVIDYIQLEGSLVHEVEHICKEKHIDLVVMGTKGSSQFDEYMVGSNTALVLEDVKCPILVIPENATVAPYKKILYATDFQFDDVEILVRLMEFADLFGATIEVVHISKEPRKDEEILESLRKICFDRIKYTNISFSNIVENNSTLQTLNNLIQAKGIDLVSMSSTGKGFLKKLFTGSMTKKMAYQTSIPFMAFHVRRDNHL